MVTTGRRISAPAVDLIELSATNGLKHQAVVHRENWRGHPLIASELQSRLGFMEQPETSGICRLVAHEPETGTFVYPTGTVWTVAEIVRTFAENGASAGVKAGLELGYLVAESLVEAADGGLPQGIPSHGNVNPWTVVLKGDGQPAVLAYGIPQVEMAAWREDSRIAMVEDSFRYAPPERIEGGEEDLSSDLFSLALVALEVMVGRPVYDGVLADVKQQATRGEGMRRLYQWRERLPQNVREVLGRALKPDPDTRFPNGLELVYAVHDLLGSIDVEGPSLTEVMAKVRASEKRGKALKGGQTQLLTKEEMAELAADLGDFDEPIRPPRRPRPDGAAADEPVAAPAPGAAPAGKARWSKPTRRAPDPAGANPSSANAMPATPVEAADVTPTRRRRSRDESLAVEPTIDREAERDLLRRRLRVRSGDNPQPPTSSSVSVPPTANEGSHTLDGVRSEAAAPEAPAAPGERVISEESDIGSRAKSAAAALLERLRTSGAGRRRVRGSTDGADPVTAPETVPVSEQPTIHAVPPRSPTPTPPPARPTTGHARPTPAPPRAAPPPPPPVALRTVTAPVVDRTADDVPLRRWVDVVCGPRKIQLPWRPNEAPWALALRAGIELGGFPLDPSGRLVAAYRVVRDGAPVVTPIEPGPYELAVVPAESRLVEIVVQTEPPTRLRTQLALVAPAGWIVAGMVGWLALPPGDWAVWTDGSPVDPEQLLIDALGKVTTVEIRIRGS